MSDFEWVAGVTDEPYVLFSSAESGIESVEDLQAFDGTLRMGAVGAASPTFVIGVIASDLFDLGFDYVTAYPGSGDAMTGAVRGDFEIGAFEASRSSSSSRAAILSVRPIALPPDSPPEIVNYWAEVLEASITDPDLAAWSEETGRETSWSSPEETRQRVDGAFQFMQWFEDRILEEFERVGE